MVRVLWVVRLGDDDGVVSWGRFVFNSWVVHGNEEVGEFGEKVRRRW